MVFRRTSKRIIRVLSSLLDLYPQIILQNQQSNYPRFYTHPLKDLDDFKKINGKKIFKIIAIFEQIVNNLLLKIKYRFWGLLTKRNISLFICATFTDKKSEICNLSPNVIAKTNLSDDELYPQFFFIFIQPKFSLISNKVNLDIIELFPCISITPFNSKNEIQPPKPVPLLLNQKPVFSVQFIDSEVSLNSKMKIEIQDDKISLVEKISKKQKDIIFKAKVNPEINLELNFPTKNIYQFFSENFDQFKILYSRDRFKNKFGSIKSLKIEEYSTDIALNKVYLMDADKSSLEKILATKLKNPFQLIYLENILKLKFYLQVQKRHILQKLHMLS